MAVVALSWLAAAYIGAIPLYLSGHFPTLFDAYFDAMSGFTTTGLATINDLDHGSDSINLWRLLMQFLGGQGLVKVANDIVHVGDARHHGDIIEVVGTFQRADVPTVAAPQSKRVPPPSTKRGADQPPGQPPTHGDRGHHCPPRARLHRGRPLRHHVRL